MPLSAVVLHHAPLITLAEAIPADDLVGWYSNTKRFRARKTRSANAPG